MKLKYVWGFKASLGLVVSLEYDSKTLMPGPIKVRGEGPTLTRIKASLETGLDMDGHLLGTHTYPNLLEAYLAANFADLKPFRASPHPVTTLERTLPPGFIY